MRVLLLLGKIHNRTRSSWSKRRFSDGGGRGCDTGGIRTFIFIFIYVYVEILHIYIYIYVYAVL